MRIGLRRLLGLACVGCACSGNDGKDAGRPEEEGPVESGPTLIEFSRGFAQAWCEGWRECCEAARADYEEESCQRLVERQLELPATANLIDYDPEAASRCVLAITEAAARCERSNVPDACERAVRGSVRLGEECSVDLECARFPSGKQPICADGHCSATLSRTAFDVVGADYGEDCDDSDSCDGPCRDGKCWPENLYDLCGGDPPDPLACWDSGQVHTAYGSAAPSGEAFVGSVPLSCGSTSREIVCNDDRVYRYECTETEDGCGCQCLRNEDVLHECSYAAAENAERCLEYEDCGFPDLSTATEDLPSCILDEECPKALPVCDQYSGECKRLPSEAPPTCWQDAEEQLMSLPTQYCAFQRRLVGCEDGSLYELGCNGDESGCSCTCQIDGLVARTCVYGVTDEPCMLDLRDCEVPSPAAAAVGAKSCLSEAVCPSSLPHCYRNSCSMSGTCSSRPSPLDCDPGLADTEGATVAWAGGTGGYYSGGIAGSGPAQYAGGVAGSPATGGVLAGTGGTVMLPPAGGSMTAVGGGLPVPVGGAMTAVGGGLPVPVGGSMPACPAGESLCAEACVDLSRDPSNCGLCGLPCSAGRTCLGGVCTCSPGLLLCSGSCVDSSIDPAHCGSCDSTCGTGLVCADGECACPPGLVACGNECVGASGCEATGGTGGIESGGSGGRVRGGSGGTGSGATDAGGAPGTGATSGGGTSGTGGGLSGGSGGTGGDLSGGSGATGGDLSGGSGGTGGFDILDGGYVTSGDWAGYAWTYSDVASTITPTDFNDLTSAATSLCASGIVGPTEDYTGLGLIGVNLNQALETDERRPWSPTGIGIGASVLAEVESPLQLQIQGEDPTEWWCVVIEPGEQVVTWDQFTMPCVAGTDGTPYTGQPLVALSVLVPGETASPVPFSFCITDLWLADSTTE